MNSKLKFLLILLITVTPLTTVLAHLQWTPENGVYIRQGHHIEWYRGGEGRWDRGEEETAFVWSDCRWTRGGEGDRGVFIEIINSDGEVVFGNERGGLMVANARGRQEDPGVWPSSDGGWFIAWEDFDVDSLGDIYCTKINSDYEIVWGTDEPERVPVCVQNGVQEGVRIVDDGEGGCIIAWKDLRNGDQGDLYAQHIRSDGRPDPNWTANGIAVARAPGGQLSHTADTDGAGGMMLGWKDGREEGDANIWVQRINPEGELMWGNGQGLIVCGEASNQGTPKLCPDGAGGIFVSWVDERNVGGDPATGKDIFVQRVNADGELMWDDNEGTGVELCTANREQTSNRIVASRSGEAIVSWEDYRSDPDIRDIYAMRISGVNDMVKEWNQPQGMPVCINEDNQQGARLFPDGAGGAFFVWEDERDGGTPEVDIWAQRLSISGEPVWAEDGVPVCTSDHLQHSALVRISADGAPNIIWADFRSGSQLVYLQRLNPNNGSPIFAENGIVASSIKGFGGNGQDPILMSHGGGLVSAVWSDGRFGHWGSVPFVQFIEDGGDAPDTLLPAHGIPVMDLLGDESLVGGGQSPAAVGSDDGNVFVVWEDHRIEQIYSIYAQKVNSAGELLWGDGGVKAAGFPNGQEQLLPHVCLDGEGGIITVWKGRPDDFVFTNNLTMQRFDADGNRMWGDDGIRLTFHDMDQEVEQLLHDPVNGGAIVIWRADNRDTDDDIWMTRVDLDGNIDDNFDDGDGGLIVCDDIENQRNVAATIHEDGIVVAWVDSRDAEEEILPYIYAQFVEWDGTVRWRENGRTICDEETDLDNPVVAADADGNIWIVWEDHRNIEEGDSRIDIFMQKLLPDGELVFARNGIPVCSEDKNQLRPSIIANGLSGNQAGMWIFWEDYRYNEGLWADIFAKHLDLTGEQFGNWADYDEGVWISRAYHGQEKPQLALLNDDGEGGVVTLFEDKRSTGKEELFNLYTQRIHGAVPVRDREPVQHPTGFALNEIYPNPFNDKAIISFTTPHESLVKLNLYDINGRLVSRIGQNSLQAGRHAMLIDGRDLASGTYIVRLEAENIRLEKTLNLIK